MLCQKIQCPKWGWNQVFRKSNPVQHSLLCAGCSCHCFHHSTNFEANKWFYWMWGGVTSEMFLHSAVCLFGDHRPWHPGDNNLSLLLLLLSQMFLLVLPFSWVWRLPTLCASQGVRYGPKQQGSQGGGGVCPCLKEEVSSEDKILTFQIRCPLLCCAIQFVHILLVLFQIKLSWYFSWREEGR